MTKDDLWKRLSLDTGVPLLTNGTLTTKDDLWEHLSADVDVHPTRLRHSRPKAILGIKIISGNVCQETQATASEQPGAALAQR